MAFEEQTDPHRLLSTDEILGVDDLRVVDVYVSQWRGSVRIKALSKKQVTDIINQSRRWNPVTKAYDTDETKQEELLVTASVTEPHWTAEDYRKIQEKSVAAIVTIVKAINKLNGLGEDAIDEATKSAEERSAPSLRVLSSARAEDDQG